MSDANLDLFYCILFSRTKEENQTFLDCDAYDFKEPYVLSKEEQKALAEEIKKEPGADIFFRNLQFEVTDELAEALKTSSVKSLSIHDTILKKGTEQKIFDVLKESPSLESFEIKNTAFRNPFKAAAAFNAFLKGNRSLEEVVCGQEGLFSRLIKEGFAQTSASELVYKGSEESALEVLSKNKNILKITLSNHPQFTQRADVSHTLTEHRLRIQEILKKLKQAFDEEKKPDTHTLKEATQNMSGLKYLVSFQGWEDDEIGAFETKLKSIIPHEKNEKNSFTDANKKKNKKTSIFTAKYLDLLKRKTRA